MPFKMRTDVAQRREKIKTLAPRTISKSFEMLMKTIDNPTEAAARHITASRKLMAFFNKLGSAWKKIGPHYR